ARRPPRRRRTPTCRPRSRRSRGLTDQSRGKPHGHGPALRWLRSAKISGLSAQAVGADGFVRPKARLRFLRCGLGLLVRPARRRRLSLSVTTFHIGDDTFHPSSLEVPFAAGTDQALRLESLQSFGESQLARCPDGVWSQEPWSPTQLRSAGSSTRALASQ